MKLFESNIKFFKLVGLWNPFERESQAKFLAYDIYSNFVRVLMCSICLLKFFYISNANFQNINEVCERLFLFPDLITCTFKFCNIYNKQEKVSLIMSLLSDKYCLPTSSVEIERQKFFDNGCKWVFYILKLIILFLYGITQFWNLLHQVNYASVWSSYYSNFNTFSNTTNFFWIQWGQSTIGGLPLPISTLDCISSPYFLSGFHVSNVGCSRVTVLWIADSSLRAGWSPEKTIGQFAKYQAWEASDWFSKMFRQATHAFAKVCICTHYCHINSTIKCLLLIIVLF